jgi:hypothetical protein
MHDVSLLFVLGRKLLLTTRETLTRPFDPHLKTLRDISKISPDVVSGSVI